MDTIKRGRKDNEHYKKELRRAKNDKKTIEKERFSLRGGFCGAVNRIIMTKNELFGTLGEIISLRGEFFPTLGEIISLRTTFARELIAHYKKEN